MKYCHTITLSVFIKPEDSNIFPDILDKTKSAIKELFDWEKEKIELNETIAEGFEERKIHIYEIKLLKEKDTNIFIKNLLSKLSIEQKEFLKYDKEYRLDENDDFFIRLDKRKLLEGEYVITHSGDCFHIKMNIASFPKNRENSLKVIDEILKI
ncbi:MAG: hypothetical protein KatS3mg002_0118 [Candidatus Woesearchaeota archaeon]|nr:MAG: hypothetical protein KatS3mg002_0118 [Candidatus Woesearchaeota archaeon]